MNSSKLLKEPLIESNSNSLSFDDSEILVEEDESGLKSRKR